MSSFAITERKEKNKTAFIAMRFNFNAVESSRQSVIFKGFELRNNNCQNGFELI